MIVIFYLLISIFQLARTLIGQECGDRPHDGDRDSTGNRHKEWDSQICENKREEEGRLGRRQEKEEKI